jgi:hypothetical protein
MKPFVSRLIEVVKANRTDFKVVAVDQIPPHTIVEVCPTLAIQNKLAIIIGKNNPTLQKKIIVDMVEVDREYQVFEELSELELNKRLDQGLISQDDYAKIITSRVNINAILDAKTHVIPLGNGLLYGVSEYPNIVREYDPSTKLCSFRTVQYVQEGTELVYFS